MKILQCTTDRGGKALLERALPYLRQEFKFPMNNITVAFDRRRDESRFGGRTLGMAMKNKVGHYIVILDYRRGDCPERLLDTIAHEFAHVEQMYQCRLDTSVKDKFCWYEDGKVNWYDDSDDINKYWDWPWEVEARERGKRFRDKYAVELLPNGDLSTISLIRKYWRKLWNSNHGTTSPAPIAS